MFSLAQDAQPSSTTVTSPQIVAKGKLRNQTAPIPTTTIFTPPQDGLYRLSAYATLTRTDVNSVSTWQFSVGWSDDVGPQSAGSILFIQGNTRAGSFVWENFVDLGGASVILESKAGTPITYTVIQTDGPDNSAYALYYTLERLE
jgi:hypothetical protein